MARHLRDDMSGRGYDWREREHEYVCPLPPPFPHELTLFLSTLTRTDSSQSTGTSSSPLPSYAASAPPSYLRPPSAPSRISSTIPGERQPVSPLPAALSGASSSLLPCKPSSRGLASPGPSVSSRSSFSSFYSPPSFLSARACPQKSAAPSGPTSAYSRSLSSR